MMACELAASPMNFTESVIPIRNNAGSKRRISGAPLGEIFDDFASPSH